MRYARHLTALLTLLLAVSGCLLKAQTYTVMPMPRIQFLDNNGDPIAGGHVHTYESGTTTNLATYSDSSGTSNANPVVLDSAGRAVIYLADDSYRFQLHDSSDVSVWDQDNITATHSITATSFSSITVTGTGLDSIDTAGGIQVDGNQVISNSGMITVDGTGPHVIGGSTLDYARFYVQGNFSSGGAATESIGQLYTGTLTGANGDTNYQAGSVLNNAITTQSNSETVNIVAQLYVTEPQITVGTDTVLQSAAVYVSGAATEASNDYGLFVDGGVSRLDGGLVVGNLATLDGILHVFEDSASVNSSAGVNIEQDGTGDARLQFETTGATTWVMGIDNDVSDAFVIGDGDLGTADVLSLATGGTATFSGSLVVGGAASFGYIQNYTAGSFTSDGASTILASLGVSPDLTAANGDTVSQTYMSVGSGLGGSITTQSNSETVARVSTADFFEPDITVGTDTVTNAVTVFIQGAPTEGTNNYALLVNGGIVRIDDRLRLDPQASAPGGASSGDIYVDSTPTPDELCFYDGASWTSISTGVDANCT
jgi:hypothetical protein